MSAVGLPQSGSVAEKPSLTADGHDRVPRERQVAAEVALAHMHAERVLSRLSLAVEQHDRQAAVRVYGGCGLDVVCAARDEHAMGPWPDEA